MLTKFLYLAINLFSLVIMFVGIRLVARKKQSYAKSLRRLMIAASTTVFAYAHIAISSTEFQAGVFFCFYFAAMDWICFFLLCFSMNYTNHKKLAKIIEYPMLILTAIDTVSIFLNIVLHHVFSVRVIYDVMGEGFYQYDYLLPYYLHLVLDYAAILISLILIIIGIVTSYSFYRIKYIIILTILTSLILINLLYMAFSMKLDWSVVLYALSSMLMYYFCIHYTPNNLITRVIRQAVNEMNEGLVMFDLDNTCIFINEFVKKYFGIVSEEECSLLETPLNAALVDLSLGGNERNVKEIVISGSEGRPEERFRVNFNNLSDNKNHRLGAFLRIERITDEYNNMIELEKARNEANRASIAKSVFLANMSHEIRTPINSVLGMNEMVLREAKDTQILEYAQNIQSAGNSLLGIINDILDFSKVEAGRMDLIPDIYSIHKILRDAVNMLETRASDKGLKLEILCNENIPTGLYGDENRIRQILTNLMTNAIKYTKEGSITVAVDFENIDASNVRIIMAVSDTGIGILEEEKTKLFTAFKRLDENRNRNIEGTGLGLTITSQLLELMGGEINVESERGKGSTFTVSIPQLVKNSAPVGKFTRNAEIKKNDYREHFKAPEARVLIVDDVPMNIKVVQALLKKTELKSDTAGGGAEAFEKCKSTKYDVILMDHMMPDIDGISAYRMIKEEGLNRDSCVIVLTANAINGVEREYEEAGFADYLSKPVRGEALETMLIKYLPPEKVIRIE